MKRVPALVLAALLTVVLPVLAGVVGGDFDSMPLGPYLGPANILEGDPNNVQVRPVDAGTSHGAPLPSDAMGNMLCVDAVNKTGRIVIEFAFACDPATDGVCEVSYDFSVAQWSGEGVEVFIDPMGTYDNPVDVIDIPVGFPPSTTFGGNTETRGQCDGSAHALTFVVYPGSILYLDNMTTTCLLPTDNDEPTWGEVKTRYR